jgi:hypothetical protein
MKYLERKCADADLQLAQSVRKHTAPVELNSLEQTLGITVVSHTKLDYTAVPAEQITNLLKSTRDSSVTFCE